MTKAIREVEEMIGEVDFSPKKGQKFARSLYAIKDIKKGEKFTNENIRAIRPGFGLHPKYKKYLIGKIAKRDIQMGDRIKWEYL